MSSLLRTASLAAALCAGGCSGCSETPEPAPRHVLFVSLDTLRADACSLYGYEQPTTPFLEELARRGAVFEKHVVNSNNTLVSHATMLTGLYEAAHGTYDRGADSRVLAPEYETLAERFAAGGFETAMFTTHPAWLGRAFGLDQGFATVESGWYDARENSARFLAWLERSAPERSFVFLHFYDAHSELADGPRALPYEAPAEYLERFAPPRPADFTGSAVNRAGQTVYGSKYLEHYANPYRDLPPEHLAFLRGSYDAGVAKLDSDLRELFGELERRGYLEDALVVVTSDHGEEFKEHRRLLHMEYFDEIMRVPLVVVPPRSARPPARPRVAEMTRAIDLAPTVLELCGLPPLRFAQGRSLAGALGAGRELDYQGALFGQGILRSRDEHSEYKVCGIEKYYALYDLDADPAEQHSLVDRDLASLRVAPERWSAIQGELAALQEANERLAERIAASQAPAALSDEEREMLERLGYFGEGAEPEGH